MRSSVNNFEVGDAHGTEGVANGEDNQILAAVLNNECDLHLLACLSRHLEAFPTHRRRQRSHTDSLPLGHVGDGVLLPRLLDIAGQEVEQQTSMCGPSLDRPKETPELRRVEHPIRSPLPLVAGDAVWNEEQALPQLRQHLRVAL